MKKLRSELGDVYSVLVTIHKNLITSASLGQYFTTVLVLYFPLNVTFTHQKGE